MRLRRYREALAAALALLVLPLAAPVSAQESLFERMNLDRLYLVTFGASVGHVQPSQVEATTAYALHADYGEISPRWRVVFTTSFWRSHLEQEVVQQFADSLQKSIVGPDGAYIEPGRISISDIAVTVDLRWTGTELRHLRWYVGGGGGAHVLNAEGPLIAGTFVERALDNITAGVTGTAGFDLLTLDPLIMGAQLRYDLLSGFRYGSLRAAVSYRFGGRPRQAVEDGEGGS